jgi:predicted methyltransferase
MKLRHALFAAVSAAMLASYAPALQAQATPPAVAAAIADTNRTDADRMGDANRHPAEMMTFAGFKAGDKVAELVPGGGYVSRLISKIVGSNGHVYAVNLPTLNERFKTGLDATKAMPAYANITVSEQPYGTMKFPEPLDAVWTSENYHDFQNMNMFQTDTNAMNKAVFAALKPGGHYIITDYAGAAGTGKTQTGSLHRIDPEVIKQEVTAAGFVLEAESKALDNPADNRTERSRQGSAQVFFKFRKP